MNQRAIELYQQAVTFAYNTAGDDASKGTILESLTAGKFAELIVRECVKIADLADENGCEWIGGNILTHFGVEERKDLVCPKCGVDRTLVDELQIECDRLYRIIELNGILK